MVDLRCEPDSRFEPRLASLQNLSSLTLCSTASIALNTGVCGSHEIQRNIAPDHWHQCYNDMILY